MDKCQHLNRLASKFNRDEFNELTEEISFAEYLDKVYENPALIRTAYQRLYDMVVSKGLHEFQRYKKRLIHYNFFDDPEIPIFGLEETLDELVKFFKVQQVVMVQKKEFYCFMDQLVPQNQLF